MIWNIKCAEFWILGNPLHTKHVYCTTLLGSGTKRRISIVLALQAISCSLRCVGGVQSIKTSCRHPVTSTNDIVRDINDYMISYNVVKRLEPRENWRYLYLYHRLSAWSITLDLSTMRLATSTLASSAPLDSKNVIESFSWIKKQ